MAIEVDVSLTGERVTRVLERLRSQRGQPSVIQADNGPELRGRVLDQWAHEHAVKLQFIAPGKPIQSAYLESFNARLRERVLQRARLPVARTTPATRSKSWRIAYNRERPHSSLGNLTPEGKASGEFG